jgi:hypothetical protein
MATMFQLVRRYIIESLHENDLYLIIRPNDLTVKNLRKISYNDVHRKYSEYCLSEATVPNKSMQVFIDSSCVNASECPSLVKTKALRRPYQLLICCQCSMLSSSSGSLQLLIGDILCVCVALSSMYKDNKYLFNLVQGIDELTLSKSYSLRKCCSLRNNLPFQCAH